MTEINSKVVGLDEIPPELYAECEQRASALIHEGEEQAIRLDVDYPLGWSQVKDISRRLTLELDKPILVVPRLKAQVQNSLIYQGSYSGKYCVFEAQVIADKSENNKETIFDLVSVHDKQIKDDETKEMIHSHWNLLFPDEPQTSGYKKTDLAFKYGRHHYVLQSENLVFQAFVEDKLELGQVYRVGGLTWSAADKKNTKAVAFHDNYCMVDWAIPMRNLMTIDQTFFNKFRHLSHDQIRNSIAFPFENSISDYKELPFLAVFHIKSNTIPLNITMIGPPGCTKSGFLKRLAAISGDPYLDAGNTTIKGLMPSFAPKSSAPGAMATARTFVICNEFFDLMKNAQNNESTYDILSSMKTILEGDSAKCSSGLGSMIIIMRGSAIFGSNWISMGRGGFLTSVTDMYSRLDKALLDRILIYPINTKFQMQMKNLHERRVKELKNTFTAKTGIREEVKVLEQMDTPYPLNTYDLRTLLTFKENLVARMGADAVAEVITQGRTIQERYGVDQYTRAQDFIANIASAYAFEDALIAGKVDKDTREIWISQDNVRSAGAFYQTILHRHRGESENAAQQRRDFYTHGATKGQKMILDFLKNIFEKAADSESAKVRMDAVYDEFNKICSDISWEVSIRPLLDEKMVLWDGENLMWLPEQLEDVVLFNLFRGRQGVWLQDAELLLRLHLAEGNGIGGELEHHWLNDSLPIRPTEEVQNKILKGLELYPQSCIADLCNMPPQLGVDVIRNGVYYLHLSGKLTCADGRYSLRP